MRPGRLLTGQARGDDLQSADPKDRDNRAGPTRRVVGVFPNPAGPASVRCRGSGRSARRIGPRFCGACWRRMEAGVAFPYPPEPAAQAPWASELGVAATALAGMLSATIVSSNRPGSDFFTI
jgi:hypothetical protein